MGWETITYACGHTEQAQMYGAHAARDRAVAAAAGRDCPACVAVKAAKADVAAGLPALRGSERQTGWASGIRVKLLAEADALGAKLAAQREALARSVDATKAARLDAIANALGLMRRQTASVWWIDRRSMTAEQIVRGIIEETTK